MNGQTIREALMSIATLSPQEAAQVILSIPPEDQAKVRQCAASIGGWRAVAAEFDYLLRLSDDATPGMQVLLLSLALMARAQGYSLTKG